MDMQVIGKNLFRLRQSKKWTQEDISEKLKISRQAVSKWETGAAIPNSEALLELSKLYRITINEILEPQICMQISDFEEIIQIDSSKLKMILASFSTSEVVKASMGASPTINELLKQLCNDIDFSKERTAIGSVRITEIEEIHNRIVEMINTQLLKWIE